METRYGFPIVAADNIFETLEGLGVRAWPKIQPPASLEDFLAGQLTPQQREEARRFAPRSEAFVLQDPKGRPFTAFRSVGKNWATVFVLMQDDLVPIVAEFKHGAEVISLCLPSGVPGRKDSDLADPLSACAMREFLEETGIELESVTPLAWPEGVPIVSRQSTLRYFPFLGNLKTPIVQRERKLDSTEFLRVVLMPLKEWLKLLDRGIITEDCACSITYLALRRLGRLKVE